MDINHNLESKYCCTSTRTQSGGFGVRITQERTRKYPVHTERNRFPCSDMYTMCLVYDTVDTLNCSTILRSIYSRLVCSTRELIGYTRRPCSPATSLLVSR